MKTREHPRRSIMIILPWNGSILLLALAFLQMRDGYAQEMVPNGSFEANSSCPTFVGQIDNIDSWFDPPVHTGSADYFHYCTSSLTISIPTNYWGTETPSQGNAYVGLNLLYYNIANFREYIQVRLNTPMVAGTTYAISFKYSLADHSSYETDAFGIHLAPDTIIGTGGNGPLNVTPQITMSTVMNNKVGWTQISETYTATGGEQYMVLGNFLNDDLTPATYLDQLLHNGSYIYLEEVSVAPVSEPCQIDLGGSLTLCEGEELLLDASSISGSHLWQDGSTGASFTVIQPGTYWVQITNDECLVSDTVMVVMVMLPSQLLGNDTTVCEGDPLVLDATFSAATYLWHDGSTTPTFSVTVPGIYWVELTVDGCTITDSIEIGFLSLPILDLGTDQILCDRDTFLLDVSLEGGNYIWQDGSTGSEFMVTEEGEYWVTVEINGCTSTDTVNVDLINIPEMNWGNDTTLCEGNALVLDATYPGASYLWSDATGSTTLTITEDGIYWVELTVAGCTTVDSITIAYRSRPEVDLGEVQTICIGGTLTLEAPAGMGPYVWQDGSTGSSMTVAEAGIYWLTVGIAGCQTSDSITVEWEDCNVLLEMPNVFSPNGDGYNDLLTPMAAKGIVSMYTIIYNKWGNVIFTSHDPSIWWNGGDHPDGTYYFIVQWTDRLGQVEQQAGYLTLIR